MLVIFDCDGVLVDSEIIAARVNVELLGEAGFQITANEAAARFAGMSDEQIFSAAEAEMGRAIPEELLARCESEIDRRLEDEVEAVAGAYEMLDALDAARCICSNSGMGRLAITLERTGLYDWFRPNIFSSSEVRDGRKKPAPDVFLHAAEELEFAVDQTLVVEDSVHGVAGAVAAGMGVIGFIGASHTWPSHGEALMDAGALTVVRRLIDVPATVEALAGWDRLALNL
jgi:HAD superfamily hydrolase (TIGR01509 family)